MLEFHGYDCLLDLQAVRNGGNMTIDKQQYGCSFFDITPCSGFFLLESRIVRRHLHYRLRGWDETKGWPTSQKLNQLALSDVADILQKEKLIM